MFINRNLMGLFFGNPMRRTRNALLVLVGFLAISPKLVSQEFMKRRELREYQKIYRFLRAETARIITHGKEIRAGDVKKCIKELNRLRRAMVWAINNLDDKEAKAMMEKHLRVINAVTKVFNCLYQFELEEDYLRNNIKNPDVFINVKGYIEDMLRKLDEIEKLGIETHLIAILKSLRGIRQGLIAEIKHDLRVLRRIVYSYGTEAQIKQWAAFIKSLEKRYPFLSE